MHLCTGRLAFLRCRIIYCDGCVGWTLVNAVSGDNVQLLSVSFICFFHTERIKLCVDGSLSLSLSWFALWLLTRSISPIWAYILMIFFHLILQNSSMAWLHITQVRVKSIRILWPLWAVRKKFHCSFQKKKKNHYNV